MRGNENKMAYITVIACITSDGGLDDKGKRIIPKKNHVGWLKKLVKEGVNVVGVNTYEEDPLKDILTGNEIVFEEGITEKEEILGLGDINVNILGGGNVYKEFIGVADKLILLEISCVLQSQHYFPYFNVENFKVVDFDDVEGNRFYGVAKEYERVAWEEEEELDENEESEEEKIMAMLNDE